MTHTLVRTHYVKVLPFSILMTQIITKTIVITMTIRTLKNHGFMEWKRFVIFREDTHI